MEHRRCHIADKIDVNVTLELLAGGLVRTVSPLLLTVPVARWLLCCVVLSSDSSEIWRLVALVFILHDLFEGKTVLVA